MNYTSVTRRLGTDPGNPGNPVTPKSDFVYDYDNIGNRDTYSLDSSQTIYTTNSLNQYTATANPAATLSYDDDGNLLTDGTLTYEWDAENRLKAVYPTTPNSTSRKCVFAYDYMSRRVQKQVYAWSSGSWSLASDERFVYDEWNMVLVIDANGTMLKEYTWGLDLSGSLHGAGGIGGLLASMEVTGTYQGYYWYFYDGNGNVGQVLDDMYRNVVARYEYDPYGNTIVLEGSYAAANPFRFSTKWFDDESGLGYWGYRYYSTKLGRWLSRDPIGEEGGTNIYLYSGNIPTMATDALGLAPTPLNTDVCCRYKIEVNNILGMPTSLGCFEQTISIPSSNNADCECKKQAGRRGPFITSLISASSGKCCSCKVEVRRQNNKWPYGWPNHVRLFVTCTNGNDWWSDFPGGGSDPLTGPPPYTSYDQVVDSWCVSCDTADALKANANKYTSNNGYTYQPYGWRDCYWFIRKVIGDASDSWVGSDQCDKINGRKHAL